MENTVKIFGRKYELAEIWYFLRCHIVKLHVVNVTLVVMLCDVITTKIFKQIYNKFDPAINTSTAGPFSHATGHPRNRQVRKKHVFSEDPVLHVKKNEAAN